MGRPLTWTPEQKLPLVLSVLRGEGSVAEVGRRLQVSDVTLAPHPQTTPPPSLPRQSEPTAASLTTNDPARRKWPPLLLHEWTTPSFERICDT